jgi:cold shock CspA family protein
MSTTDSTEQTLVYDETTERLFGMVKWFDKMKGYGFVQQLQTENDYFVHFSQLKCNDDHRTKYLVAGEYIQFNISETDGASTSQNTENHSLVAVNVTGIMDGPLLYESQQQSRSYHHREGGFSNQRHSRHSRAPPSVVEHQPPTEVTHTNQYDLLDIA